MGLAWRDGRLYVADPPYLVVLEDLPVTSVWIAGWLVRRIADRPGSVTGQALVDLVSLVHTFDALVTVADIGTADQARWWRAIGADVAGGALFGTVGPAAEITALLARGNPTDQF